MTDSRPHALYRFFDAEGVLLYIGITADVPARFQKHRDDKPWWGEVARIAMEPFPDRPSVLAAERRAIKAEMPRWNVQHQIRAKKVARPRPSPSPAAWTSILTCHGCKKVVGNTKKNDAVVHVHERDIHEYEVAHREYERREATDPCPVCEKESVFSKLFGRFFHADGSDTEACWRTRIRDEKIIMPLRIMSVGRLLELPELVRWEVHCDACNPHYDSESDTYCACCYWFAANRCRTVPQLLSWTAHLSEKGWLDSTNWTQFVRSLNEVDA